MLKIIAYFKIIISFPYTDRMFHFLMCTKLGFSPSTYFNSLLKLFSDNGLN